MCPISCIENLADYGAFVDGPGIGMFSPAPSSLMILQFIFIAACLFAWVMWRRVQGRRDRRVALVAGMILCVAYFAFDCPRKLLALSWSHRCSRGEAAACSAAGDLYALGLGVHVDTARAATLFRSGCERGYFGACSRLLERSLGDGAACSVIAEECRNEGATEWRRKLACDVQAKACTASP